LDEAKLNRELGELVVSGKGYAAAARSATTRKHTKQWG